MLDHLKNFTMNDLIINILGWIGSFLLIAAYFMNSRNLITAQSFSYQLMNVLGSIFLAVNTIYYGAYPSSAVNIIWIFIGLHYLNKTRKHEPEIH